MEANDFFTSTTDFIVSFFATDQRKRLNWYCSNQNLCSSSSLSCASMIHSTRRIGILFLFFDSQWILFYFLQPLLSVYAGSINTGLFCFFVFFGSFVLPSFLNTEAAAIFTHSQLVKPTLGEENGQWYGPRIGAPCEKIVSEHTFRRVKRENSLISLEFSVSQRIMLLLAWTRLSSPTFSAKERRGPILLSPIRLNVFRSRSGVVNRQPSAPPPPCSRLLIVSPLLPKHHSHSPTGAFLTLNICPTLPLPWQRVGQCDGHGGVVSFAKCFQTSHSAVIRKPGHLSSNLFVFNLTRLIADVRLPPAYQYGWGWRWKVTKHIWFTDFFFLCKKCLGLLTHIFLKAAVTNFFFFLNVLGLHTMARTG